MTSAINLTLIGFKFYSWLAIFSSFLLNWFREYSVYLNCIPKTSTTTDTQKNDNFISSDSELLCNNSSHMEH